MKYYQQGDVIFKLVNKPIGAKKLKGNIVVQGSHGGNDHQIINGKFCLLQLEKDLFLEVSKSVEAVHNEHKTIKLPVGCYQIVRVLEYNHFLEESREVQD
jgi:N-acetylmuramoyl-L-alanine amidase